MAICNTAFINTMRTQGTLLTYTLFSDRIKQQRTFYDKYDNTNGTSTVRGEHKDRRNRSDRVFKNKATSQLQKTYMKHNSDFKHKCTREMVPRIQANQTTEMEIISRKVCLYLEHLPYFTKDIFLYGDERYAYEHSVRTWCSRTEFLSGLANSFV